MEESLRGVVDGEGPDQIANLGGEIGKKRERAGRGGRTWPLRIMFDGGIMRRAIRRHVRESRGLFRSAEDAGSIEQQTLADDWHILDQAGGMEHQIDTHRSHARAVLRTVMNNGIQMRKKKKQISSQVLSSRLS